MSALHRQISQDNLDADLDDDLDESSEVGASASQAADEGAWADTDDGRKVRVPSADTYPGTPPYAAPVLGFRGKVNEVFEGFAYLPVSGGKERPERFLPVIGLEGDDKVREKDTAHWKLHARVRDDVWAKLEEDLGPLPSSGAGRPALLVTTMRGEGLALFSLTQPQQMFAPQLWMVTMPISVAKSPMKTLTEDQVQALAVIAQPSPAVSAPAEAAPQPVALPQTVTTAPQAKAVAPQPVVVAPQPVVAAPQPATPVAKAEVVPTETDELTEVEKTQLAQAKQAKSAVKAVEDKAKNSPQMSFSF